MKTIIFATHNLNKVNELQSLLPPTIKLVSSTEYNVPDPDETENTLEGNSRLKADFVFSYTNITTIADDTGLEVEALNGQPGVYSARYAGVPANDKNNITKLLSHLKETLNRNARFRTIITLRTQSETFQFEGKVEGKIAFSPIGKKGFGYDSIFIPENSLKTFAQMELSEKNRYSHRARAIKKLLDFLKLNSSN